MNSLVLGLCLAAPAQPPGYPPYPAFPPTNRPQPQVVPIGFPRPYGPVFRPTTPVGPAFYPPAVPAIPVAPAVPPVPAVPVVPAPGFVPQTPVLTLEQFSRLFTPTPGTHHVWLIHPRTQRPVAVCFTLPQCGKLDRFEVRRRSIEFDFCRPNVEVEIIFRLNGTVDVRYRD